MRQLTTSRRAMPIHFLVALSAAALVLPEAVRADCTTRAASPAEAAFHSRALSALMSSLPPLPAGVQELDAQPHDYRKAPTLRAVLCDFSREGAFSVSARRVYVRKHSESERRHLQSQYDVLTAQFHELRKTPPALAERQNGLRQKSNDAWKAARDAEKAGDATGAKARDAEYRALRDEADAIDAQHQASVKPQTDALDKRRTSIDLERQKVEVRLSMNLQRLPAPGDDATRGAFGVASPAQSGGLKVHNTAFVVEGTEGPLRQALAASVDRARLGGLVGQPLSDEAESGAFAAKARPVTVAEIAGPASPSPATGGEPRGNVGSTAGALSPAPATTSVPQAVDAPSADPIRQATDAVNKLRGLLGR